MLIISAGLQQLLRSNKLVGDERVTSYVRNLFVLLDLWKWLKFVLCLNPCWTLTPLIALA